MWIWQAEKWPYFEVDAQALQPALSAARLAQGRMLGVAGNLQLVDLAELQLGEWTQEAVATAQIEGEALQVNSVRASAARRLGLTAANRLPRDDRTEATLDIVEAAVARWNEPLAEASLLDWHAALFPNGRSGITRIVTGAYRVHEDPMQIVTPRLGKPDTVHYEAPPSRDVPAQMKALLEWFEEGREHPKIDGIVRSAIAHLWFEVVHPFEDGNGRIGRALSDLALAQDLRSNQRLFSMSQQLWLDRAGYYGQLQAASAQGHMDVTSWVRWFIGCVEKACLSTLAQIQAAGAKAGFWAGLDAAHPQLTPSQRKVVNKLYDAGPDGFLGGMSTEKYVAIAGVSRATAYRELTEMVELGVMTRTGQGRGTRYALIAGL
ncbi:Fic family protein [Variovorax sp. ZS18.2.2]|uniref:Fic family protein n=1 Tax=Variovorax sp. ZS18.2.2 TaxID=2971255 RepID=UPI002151F298|nr:Fic family protein [Variovorax sp. ZS18.2.2]MCR6476866.1 Fic family protein [Variovorax sp. ZS18.2.2]